jgi:hypothetical protein
MNGAVIAGLDPAIHLLKTMDTPGPLREDALRALARV